MKNFKDKVVIVTGASSGIGEAMARIDETSQQNAALAEQASAACDTMHARTATLQRAVQIFDQAR